MRLLICTVGNGNTLPYGIARMLDLMDSSWDWSNDPASPIQQIEDGAITHLIISWFLHGESREAIQFALVRQIPVVVITLYNGETVDESFMDLVVSMDYQNEFDATVTRIRVLLGLQPDAVQLSLFG